MVKQNGDLRTLVQRNKINKPTAELTTAYCTSIHHMTSQLLTQLYFIVSSNILKFVLLNKYRRLSKSSKKSRKYSTKLKKKESYITLCKRMVFFFLHTNATLIGRVLQKACREGPTTAQREPRTKDNFKNEIKLY